MSAVFDRLQALLGAEGVERDPHGLPCAVPESDDALVLVLQAAADAGWRLRVEGQGSWLPADAPADLAVSTRALRRILQVSPDDLVATVEAGVPLDLLRAELERQRLWLAIDPPGRPDRTLGSIVASGTAGPLRHGFGPVRDQVLGVSAVTGDGRLIEAGGRVVKNVAGYDLTKLHVGGFGAFGVLTAMHLRLRALPALDVTVVARGSRDTLFLAALELVRAQAGVAALEVLSPATAAGPEWTLAARLAGTAEGVEAEAAQLAAMTRVRWERLDAEQAAAFWTLVARGPLDAPVALRLGALVDSVEEVTALVAETLGEGLLSAGAGSGAIRWAGAPVPAALTRLRHAAAQREVPVTLERAPWALRQAVGHFGAYREGVGNLVTRLRATFDPRHTFQVALEARDD